MTVDSHPSEQEQSLTPLCESTHLLAESHRPQLEKLHQVPQLVSPPSITPVQAVYAANHHLYLAWLIDSEAVGIPV